MNEMLRVNRSREVARQAYNRLSGCYDWLAGRSEDKFRRIGLQRLNASEGEAVLEIGYGTGHSVLELACAVGESGRVIGIDISDRMHEIASARITAAGLGSRVRLERADAIALPYPDGSLDAVFLCFTLELFDTPELLPILKECLRVLRLPGRICVVAMSKLGNQGPMSSLYEWAHGKAPRYVDCRPIYAEELLQTAGFKTTERSIHSMWGLPIEIVLSYKG